MKQVNFYALFIGINAYQNCRQLNGCINDVLAVSRFFEELCKQQSLGEDGVKINWCPRFLLLPHEAEKALLEARGIEYEVPTRQQLIDAFSHFETADPDRGDYCLMYYSGHGSYVDAPEFFEAVSPEGTLQTLVCADSRGPGGKDLLDKELAYLIAKTLNGKTNLDNKPGVHFLSIFDSCHSGSVSRSDAPVEISARMEAKGNAISDPKEIFGFDPKGNELYVAFKDGQEKVAFDGLKHARYINLSASRDAEVAQERILDSYIEQEAKKKRQHGVFSFCLLRTLERSGLNLSYGELMKRVAMDVRSLVDKQIPVLGKTFAEDDDLYFLKGSFKAKKQVYQVASREVFTGTEWYLDAGAINGIVPSNQDKKSLVQLTDGSERLVEIMTVNGMESILDAKAFTEADGSKNLEAVVHSMPFKKIPIGFDSSLSNAECQDAIAIFEAKDFHYIQATNSLQNAQYLVKVILEADGKRNYMLTRNGSDIPVFMRNANLSNLLEDTNQVGKWENTLQLANPGTQIQRKDIKIHCRTLEGLHYAEALSTKPASEVVASMESFYSKPVSDPEEVFISYKKSQGQYAAPVLEVEIENTALASDYWVGALYLDSQFGITHKNLEVQQLVVNQKNKVKLSFTQGNLHLPFIPINFDAFYHEHGISEISDYLLIVVARKQFDLENFEQKGLPMDVERGQGFMRIAQREDDWFTIKIPIRISWPIESVRLSPGESKGISRTFAAYGDYLQAPKSNALNITAPDGFSAIVAGTTLARAKRVAAQDTRSTLIQKSIVPAPQLFSQCESGEGVFSRSMAAAPDNHLSILELTQTQGTLSPAQPLKITPGDPLLPEESIVPFAYDEEMDIYYPIGFTNPAGEVIIEQLPTATSQVIGSDADSDEEVANNRSLGKSIKLFFNKVVWSRLSGEHNYRMLALQEPDKIGEERPKITYYGTQAEEDQADLQKMKDRLAQLMEASGKTEVLLVVHGIIGNTDAQVEAVFEKTAIHKRYAAILSFDYENLNTDIGETAKHLHQSLKDLGIKEKQLVILAHSMGGLVSRYMIEQDQGTSMVKQLLQAGTPNAGSEISDFRKKLTGWLALGINGLAFVQPYLPILSFIGKGLEKRIFKTLDQMGPGSAFLSKLNSGSGQSKDLNYALIAGNTRIIKAGIEKKDPVWKKLLKALKKRGAYLALDYLVFDDDANDMAVKVESMKVLPHAEAPIEEIDCDHLSYFTNEASLKLIEKLLK